MISDSESAIDSAADISHLPDIAVKIIFQFFFLSQRCEREESRLFHFCGLLKPMQLRPLFNPSIAIAFYLELHPNFQTEVP